MSPVPALPTKIAAGTEPAPVPRLPAGSCDCHFHVFDASRYAYSPQRHYTPPDAPLAAYLASCARFGIDRGVLVHPTVFGADHSSFEEILQAHPARLRGVAVVAPDTPEQDIARWHSLGARGTRVTTIFPGDPDLQAIRRIAEKVKPFGWHLQLLVDVVQRPGLVAQVLDMGVGVVVDHLGHHPAEALSTSAGFANLGAQIAEGRTWVKLSAPYRVTGRFEANPQLTRVVATLVKANPNRLVWGTDWPHPNSPHPVPWEGRLIGLVFDWLADADLQERVLVQNPLRLYWS